MHVTIRAFQPDDLEALVYLDQVCFPRAFRLEYPGLKALLEDPRVAVLVAAQAPDPEPDPIPAPNLQEAVPSEAAAAETPPSSATAPSPEEASPEGAGPEPVAPEVAQAARDAATAAPQARESAGKPARNIPARPADEASDPEDPEEEDASSAAPREPELPPIVAGILIRSDPEPARLAIISLMVHPELRRLGLGRRLVGWAQRMGAAFRAGELLAPLEAENTHGGLFLDALGFERLPGAPPFFAQPEQGSLWRLALPGNTP